MQRQPDGAVAVLGQLDEVIAAAQRAERQPPVPVVLVGRRARLVGEPLERRDTRPAAVAVSFALFLPALIGMRRSMPGADGRRVAECPRASSGVRTAIMPQPMSTPTAAGMTAPWVASTVPTVAPLP